MRCDAMRCDAARRGVTRRNATGRDATHHGGVVGVGRSWVAAASRRGRCRVGAGSQGDCGGVA
eukprot:5225121-Lingulodinium_polyedra.AAC.1